MVIRKIIRTELLLLTVLALHFYPVTWTPVIWEWLQAVLWGVLVFFVLLYLPGWRFSRIFFRAWELSSFERFMCSFALSLGYVVIASLYLTLAWGTIDTYQGILLSTIAITVAILRILITWRQSDYESND